MAFTAVSATQDNPEALNTTTSSDGLSAFVDVGSTTSAGSNLLLLYA